MFSVEPSKVPLPITAAQTSAFTASDGRAASEIGGVGAQHRWTFEAAAGQSISVTGSQPCGDQLYWIERPSGSRFGTTSTCYGLTPQAQAESGPYTLVIDSNGATGAYDLTVVTG